MSDVREETLDRHFAVQLKLVSDVFIESICTSHHDIIHRWLLVFYGATGSEKYARNCLMILMYGQLKEMGRLGKPFTDLSNTTRRLEDVLSTYGNDNDNDNTNCAQSKELALDTDSVCSSGAASTSRGSEKKSDYELQTLKNRQLLDEVNELHARTVQNEQHYKQADSNWQRKVSEGQSVLPPAHSQRNMALLLKIEISTRNAIRRLRDWTPSCGAINFLTIALQDMLDDEPETRSVLLELDRKLEQVLDNLLEQAGERREKNVRILYDKLFQQQQEMLLAKDKLLLKEHAALATVRQQLQAKERIWEIVTPYYRDETKPASIVEDTTKIEERPLRKSGGGIARKPSPAASASPSSSATSTPQKKKPSKCHCDSCLRVKPKFHSKC